MKKSTQDLVHAIMSDDGKKMLVSQCIFKPGNEMKPDKRYVYKILTFN